MSDFKMESYLKPCFLSRLDVESKLLLGVPRKHLLFLCIILPMEDQPAFPFCSLCWIVAWRGGE